VYERLRTLLAEELGTSPGADTQELHQRLLRETAEAQPDA
jgi:DNA-binding SARP family transcriptional activator